MSERGSAMLVAVVVSATAVLLGMSILLSAGTERGMATNERLDEQALAAAESGARLVRAWFDDPSGTDLPGPIPVPEFDRSLRLIDHDDDPATAPVPQDGTTWPRYKQAVDRDGDGLDDLLDRPYRGSWTDKLAGTAAGPDARLDASRSPAAARALKDISRKLFGHFPQASAGVEARLTRIDVYGPPTMAKAGGGRVRLGIATVEVAAAVVRRRGASDELLGERSVRVVLGEIPYAAAGGPVRSCSDADWPGRFTARWGTATVLGRPSLGGSHAGLASSWPRAPLVAATVDLLWGWDDDAAFAAYRSWLVASGEPIEDPWFRLLASGGLPGAPSGPQPFPFGWDPASGAAPAAGERPNHDDPLLDGDHSNLFQLLPVADLDCSEFDYGLWKSIATSGRRDVHHYTWESGSRFREDGEGPARDFRAITDRAEGLFFFDTADGREPRDDDGDGLADNLTPAVRLSAGTWSFRGAIYLNATGLVLDGVRGRVVALRAPGEPWQDRDADGRHDPDEPWINLRYPRVLGDTFRVDPLDNLQDDGTFAGGAVRNARGPEVQAEAVLHGLLINAGTVASGGDARYYGALVARQGFLPVAGSTTAPEVYYETALGRDWPPPGVRGPRVRVTRWDNAR